jgi:hypothetical protein
MFDAGRLNRRRYVLHEINHTVLLIDITSISILRDIFPPEGKAEDLLSIRFLESDIADYRHVAKHVPISNIAAQEIDVDTTASVNGVDCDVTMEISSTPDKNAARVVVETPVDSEYCSARQNIQAQLKQHNFRLDSQHGGELPQALPAEILDMAFEDFEHNRGSAQTGVNDALSGPQNFVKSYAPKADPAKLIEDLGKRYEVSLTSIKGWTTGGPILSLLDAIVNLRKQRAFESNDVRRIVVRSATSQAERVNNRKMPDINVQYLVAVMLIDKTLSFPAAHDKARMQDPAILRERAKVELIGDEELEKLLPTRVGVVEIELTDGTHLTERVENARGTPENPMTRDEVVAKARGLMTPVLGAATATKLIDRLLDIESVKNVRELRPLLQRA